MKKTMVVLLMSLVLGALGVAPAMAADGVNVSSVAAGATIGAVNSAAGFTSGPRSTVDGFITAVAGVTIGT